MIKIKKINCPTSILMITHAYLLFFSSLQGMNAQTDPNIAFSLNTPSPLAQQAPLAPLPTTSVTPPLETKSPVPPPTPTIIKPVAAKSTNSPGTELMQIKDIKDDTEPATIYLNFDNASLLSVLNYLGEQKKINIIPHKDLEAVKVSLSTRTPITLDRAWNILLTLLEMNGFSIIKVGPLYRVVPSKDNGFEPLPTYSSGTGTEPENLPDSDLIVRYIYFFKNIKYDLAQGILRTMLDEKGIIANKDLNACIIKEQCFNIKAAFRILKALDTDGLSEQIKILPPFKYVTADTVYKLFEEILKLGKEEKVIRFGSQNQQERAYFSSSTRMYPDPIKNTLILLGTEKNLDKITEFIYKYIDVPLGSAESRLHLYELRYANAETLKTLLADFLKPPSGQGSDKSPMVGEYKYFEDVIISAEKTGSTDGSGDRGGGNRLIIACNKDDWKRLQAFLGKLDKPQPQIAIEVMIVNIQEEDKKQLGVQNWNFKGKPPFGQNSNIEFTNLNSNKSSKKTDAQGNPIEASSYLQLAQTDYEGLENPTFVTLGKEDQSSYIWAIIKAKSNTTNSHIVAQPYLVTNNNQQCSVSVNTTALVAGGLDSKKGEASIQKQVPITAKTGLTIKPRINLNGLVEMEIEVNVSEFQSIPTQDVATRLERLLKTRATLYTGEVLVLGGLTRNLQSEDVWKTPILGDIPILGTLFKNKKKTDQQTNLYIFIRPSIIKPRFEGAPDEYTQLKLDYAKYQIMKNDTYVKDRDPIQRWFFKPPTQSTKQVLTDRQNGIYRPIDDFAFGKVAPKSVLMEQDPYYKVSEEIKAKELEQKAKRKKKKPEEIRTATTIKLS